MSPNELTINESGEGNAIDVTSLKRATNSKLEVKGRGNQVTFADGCVLNGFSLTIEGDNNELHVGPDARLTGRFIMKLVPGNRIIIGPGTSIGGANIICGEGTAVEIGGDSMLSFGIEIRTTDSHAIFDKTTGERVNLAQGVIVGEHVWLGAYSVLLGGSIVPSGSVVGIRSLISGALPEPDAVYGGVPAKLLRRNVRWERPLLG